MSSLASRNAKGIGALEYNASKRGISRGNEHDPTKSKIPRSLKNSSLGMAFEEPERAKYAPDPFNKCA